jgi:hypothetical protein
LNALAAFENVHGYYLAPNGNGPTETLPFGYTDATLAPQLDCSANPGNCRFDKYGNTYVTMALYFTETCIAPVGNGQASRYNHPNSIMVYNQQQQASIIITSDQSNG